MTTADAKVTRVREVTITFNMAGCLLPFAVIYGGVALLLLIAIVVQQVIYG